MRPPRIHSTVPGVEPPDSVPPPPGTAGPVSAMPPSGPVSGMPPRPVPPKKTPPPLPGRSEAPPRPEPTPRPDGPVASSRDGARKAPSQPPSKTLPFASLKPQGASRPPPPLPQPTPLPIELAVSSVRTRSGLGDEESGAVTQSLATPTTSARVASPVSSPAPSDAHEELTTIAMQSPLRPGSVPELNVDLSVTAIVDEDTASEEAPLEVDEELRRRVERLRRDDPVGAARAHVELGLMAEWKLNDREGAKKHYELARGLVRTMAPALTRVRRLVVGTPQRADALAILQDELSLAETDELRADLHAARARIHESLNQMAEARQEYARALKLVKDHAGSLRALESVLRREIAAGATQLNGELAAHLGRLAEAYAPQSADADKALGAWLWIERADVVERALGDVSQARDALDRGVDLEPNPGPVRQALVRHLSRHDRDATLANALRVEAEREADNARASRLLYAASRIALDRLENISDGLALLTSAEGRAPQGSPTQIRILDELALRLEADNNFVRVAEVRAKRLTLARAPEAIAYEYVRLCEAYHRLGRPDLAADAAQRALNHDASSYATRERLDQALQRLGRHADRVRAWIIEANTNRPVYARIASFRKAADIAARHLNQKEQAVETLRAAWLLEPGAGPVFDDLAALLTPSRNLPEAELGAAMARVDLYLQAAAVETDADRKIGMLEKVVLIFEDEIGDPKRAMEYAEQILAVEPGRRAAILSLARNARRANDLDRLSSSLSEEAKITQDARLRCRLWLEAGEISERVGDRERALVLLERALTSKPNDRETLRAKVRMLGRLNRYDDARKTLTVLAQHSPEEAFEVWLEIAELDEALRKNPLDAVEAYREAARVKPQHPLPKVAITRLLRASRNYTLLVETLDRLLKEEQTRPELLRLLVMQAEARELCLNDDAAALQSLEAADGAAREALAEDEVPYDPYVFESIERILARQGDVEGLTRLYARWLERKPPAAIDHALRIALAGALAQSSSAHAQAVDVLEALVAVVPNNVYALRLLERLYRERQNFAALSTTLYAEATIFQSRLARVGALWELVGLEDRIGPSTTLDALSRITHEYPNDCGALDTVVRIASRIVAGVGVAHPALIAAKKQLHAAIVARRDLSLDPVARAAYHLELAMLQESSDDEAERQASLGNFGEALSLWPDSFLAARGLERMATALGDPPGVIDSQLALAKLVENHHLRARHYVRAAELIHSHQRDERRSTELFELALEIDADNPRAATALASFHKADPRRLMDQFRQALERASKREQMVFLATQIGLANLELAEVEGRRPDFGPGIAALRQVLTVVPEDVAIVFLLARLFEAQKAWGEARDTLLRVIQLSHDNKTRIRAYFHLVDIYEGPLADLELAERSLTQILGLDATNKLALERLYALAVKRNDQPLVRNALERLAEFETDATARTEYQLRLADVCREAGDNASMIRALADAIVSAPNDLRAWNQLARVYRTESQDGATAYARAIEQVIDLAKSRRKPAEPRWLVTLGMLEVNILKKPAEGVAHLQAASAVGVHPEMRAALGQGLLAVGRNKDAVLVLRELLTAEGDTLLRLTEPSQFSASRGASIAGAGTILSASLSCLDAALATEGRSEERGVVEEVRAALGELPAERTKVLRGRRLEPEAPYPNSVAGTELIRHILPEARSPMVDVASALAPIAGKALRFDLENLGVGSRNRIGTRDGHPTRAIADRISRALALPEFELYLTPSWKGAIRVYPGDPPALVGPTSFSELPESEQTFAIARLLVRIALGFTWLDEISIDGGDGLLLASVRSVLPQFGVGELTPAREHALNNMLPNVQRAIGRRQRRAIEDIAPNLNPQFDFRTISIGVRRTEYRVAYLVGGDLLAAVDFLRRVDSDIARSTESPRVLLQHPVTNELIRYALSSDAFAERRRIGSIWRAG